MEQAARWADRMVPKFSQAKRWGDAGRKQTSGERRRGVMVVGAPVGREQQRAKNRQDQTTSRL
jgi:hypothetical protein